MNTKNGEQKVYRIVLGPSKDLLFDACKYAYSDNCDIRVDFNVAAGYTYPQDRLCSGYIPLPVDDVRITGLEYEDGSGNKFNLHGYCRADLNAFDNSSSKVFHLYRFRAFYDTRRRTGEIMLFPGE